MTRKQGEGWKRGEKMRWREEMQQGSKVTFLLLLKEKQTEVYMYYQSVCMLHYEMLLKFPRKEAEVCCYSLIRK
mgnify:CR=1 FL=1